MLLFRNIGLDVPPNNVDDSIDYCYLRPQYVSAVNDLLRMEFWPDIDGEIVIYLVFRFVPFAHLLLL